MSKPLRKCLECGLEAWTEEDLEKFRKNKRSLYGRMNYCRECFNKQRRKGGKLYDNVKKQNSKWQENNRDKTKNYHRKYELKHIEKRRTNQISFKGKQIRLNKNPRTNICSICKKRYPEELKRQTSMHHYKYDSKNIIANTIELCVSCHAKIHHKMRKLNRS